MHSQLNAHISIPSPHVRHGIHILNNVHRAHMPTTPRSGVMHQFITRNSIFVSGDNGMFWTTYLLVCVNHAVNMRKLRSVDIPSCRADVASELGCDAIMQGRHRVRTRRGEYTTYSFNSSPSRWHAVSR